MKKYNKSKIMKRAWNLFKGNAKMNNFSECLKKAWAEAKEAVKVIVKYSIKDWFYKKLIEEKRSGSWIVYNTFSKEDVIKDTEKAVCVNMGVYNAATGAESIYTKKCWIPKSCIYEYRF